MKVKLFIRYLATMQHQKKRGKIFVKQFFRIKTHFFAIRGCFSQMFVLQKEFLFARGLNWDQSCLWKTPPSHFLLFSPLACPYFFYFFSSPDFWGVKEAPCKNLYVFGENWQRNQFPKLTTFLLHFSPMSPLCHSAMINQLSLYCLLCPCLLKLPTQFNRPYHNYTIIVLIIIIQ